MSAAGLNGWAQSTLCESCRPSMHPGILFPVGTDGDFTRCWVERCDDCALYESDDDAAAALAQQFGVAVAWAPAGGSRHAQPFAVDACPFCGLDVLNGGDFHDCPRRCAECPEYLTDEEWRRGGPSLCGEHRRSMASMSPSGAAPAAHANVTAEAGSIGPWPDES